MNVIKKILRNWLFKSEYPIVPVPNIQLKSDDHIMRKICVSIEVDNRVSESDIDERVCYMIAKEMRNVMTVDHEEIIDPYHTKRIYSAYVAKNIVKNRVNINISDYSHGEYNPNDQIHLQKHKI